MSEFNQTKLFMFQVDYQLFLFAKCKINEREDFYDFLQSEVSISQITNYPADDVIDDVIALEGSDWLTDDV